MVERINVNIMDQERKNIQDECSLNKEPEQNDVRSHHIIEKDLGDGQKLFLVKENKEDFNNEE